MILFVEVLTAVAILAIETSVHLLSLVFSSTWLATRTKGATRFSYCVTALTSFHLFAGIMLVVFDVAPAFLLSALYSKTVITLSLVVLLFSIAVPVSLTKLALGIPVKTAVDEEPGSSEGLYLISIFLAIAVIVGIANIATTQSSRKSLKQELCEAALSKVDDNLIGNGAKMLRWLDDHTEKDLASLQDCLDTQPDL
ncbi:hypothetical protein EBB79_06845 [Parasedimentitalea marina]|uniref:Uncharacterized protein n=1 Tax=Parasedimentitalea marina TaxID=2483033 RepID=A0A3T0N0T7_9RHOB|nr:hypothetical protein [Parasedimentitalea marina]AZV77636.1 hypothetical protein EBB79_06845 [Parasedimentitalea marina]